DGAFGLGGLAGEIDPTSGALAGLLKTARQEWPEVHCKAVDLDAAYQTLESASERIIEEMLRRGPAEVGLTESATYQVELVALPAAQPDRRQDPLLRAGEVVVISGGARGWPRGGPPGRGPGGAGPGRRRPPAARGRAARRGRPGVGGGGGDLRRG